MHFVKFLLGRFLSPKKLKMKSLSLFRSVFAQTTTTIGSAVVYTGCSCIVFSHLQNVFVNDDPVTSALSPLVVTAKPHVEIFRRVQRKEYSNGPT
jgi:hypothetical protein